MSDVADAISLEISDWTLDFSKLLGIPRFGTFGFRGICQHSIIGNSGRIHRLCSKLISCKNNARRAVCSLFKQRFHARGSSFPASARAGAQPVWTGWSLALKEIQHYRIKTI
jgi:hypothetical protein